MSQNVACASEVEIAVLREIDWRRFVRRREVVDDQLVLIGERIRHSHVEVARIAFLTIGTRVPQLERRCAARRTPHALVKSLAAAVQMIRTDVRGELVGDRKSTRLNSSHSQISYAVFCLKKKKRSRQ